MNRYANVRVYISEQARYEGKSLALRIVDHIKGLKIAARCSVFKAIEGCYENGEIVSHSVVDLSYNMPLLVDILLPEIDSQALLDYLETVVFDGAVVVLPVAAMSFRTRKRLLPDHLRVKDIMTHPAIVAHTDFSVRALVETMLDQGRNAIPIVDEGRHPIGIVTQHDLMGRAAMPIRLGLLDRLSASEKEAFLKKAEALNPADIMTLDPATVGEDEPVREALGEMVRKKKKRFPVVDASGAIVGMVSRIDILRAVSSRMPGLPEELGGIPANRAAESGAVSVRDILPRELVSISGNTEIREAVDILVSGGVQRAGVVDADGRLTGLITDRELATAFLRPAESGTGLRGFFGRRRSHGTRVSEIMKRDVVSIGEQATIEEALRLMTEQGFKRIPVVDSEGRYMGMVRRDALLIALSRMT